MGIKLRNFSEGKIKIHKDEPTIAFKFTGKEPIWKIKSEAGKKIKIIKALEAKLKPLIEEHQALKKDIAIAKDEFWKGFMEMFDEESQKQLGKFDHEVSEEDLEIYCVKPDAEDEIAKMAERATKGEFGDVGEAVGGFYLNKNWSKAEARAHIREKMAKMIPEEALDQLDTIVDKITEDIYKEGGQAKGAGGFSINLNDGDIKRVI